MQTTRSVLLILILSLVGCSREAVKAKPSPIPPSNNGGTPTASPTPTPENPPTNIAAATTLPHCSYAKPICAGGLLWQGATSKQINDYMKKYDVSNCRFVAPPRCGYVGDPKKKKVYRTCLEECTP